MTKRIISAVLLIVYSILLIKIMILRSFPVIKVGHLIFQIGGADANGNANFIPFTSIVPYLLGHEGLLGFVVNILGNIIILVPFGFLLALTFRNISWKKTLAVAIALPLLIELVQLATHMGIFDIDDVILNGLGVMVGFWIFVILGTWRKEKRYATISVAALVMIALGGFLYYKVFVDVPAMNPMANVQGSEGTAAGKDLCGGTGGIGAITSTSTNVFTLEKKDGTNLTVNLKEKVEIHSPQHPDGSGSQGDLKIGDRVTVVGDAHADNTFSAEAVFVCGVEVD